MNDAADCVSPKPEPLPSYVRDLLEYVLWLYERRDRPVQGAWVTVTVREQDAVRWLGVHGMLVLAEKMLDPTADEILARTLAFHGSATVGVDHRLAERVRARLQADADYKSKAGMV